MIKYPIEIKKMTIKGVITHANNISSVFMIIQHLSGRVRSITQSSEA